MLKCHIEIKYVYSIISMFNIITKSFAKLFLPVVHSIHVEYVCMLCTSTHVSKLGRKFRVLLLL